MAEIKQKKILKSQEKYGFENISESPIVKLKRIETLRKRYDVENVSQLESVKESKKITLLENYGVDNPQKSQELRAKAKETSLLRYGGTGWGSPILVEKAIKNRRDSGLPFPGRISKINRSFAELLKRNFRESVSFEPQLTEGFFADLKVGEVLLDINPTITHNSHKGFACVKVDCSILPCLDHSPPPEERHFERALIALQKDISYIQVYDWDTPEEILELIGQTLKGEAIPAEVSSSLFMTIDLNRFTRTAPADWIELPFSGPQLRWSKGISVLDETVSTAEEMISDGWLPVYTAGNRVFRRDTP